VVKLATIILAFIFAFPAFAQQSGQPLLSLPLATPLSGAESLYVVQNGVSKQTPVNSVTQRIPTTTFTGSYSGSGTFRLTTDGNAASSTNCANLANGQAQSIDVRLVIQDTVTLSYVYSAEWIAHLYTRGANAGATLLDNLSFTTAPSGYLVAPDATRFNPPGGWTGAGATLAADITNGCLDIEVTAPTSNSHKLDVTMTITGPLAQ
jgi:hypothetical protein